MIPAKRRVLYIDMAYTMGFVAKRRQEQFIDERHSGGYFERVYGLHPLADRADKRRRSKADLIRFSRHQIVVEAGSEAHPWPRVLLPINFIGSQARLLQWVAQLIRRRKISAIYCTDPLYAGLFGLVLRALTRRPLIIYIVANYDDLYAATGEVAMPKLIPFRWLENRIIGLVLSQADLVAAGTHTLMDYARRHGAREETLEVFPVAKFLNRRHFVPPEERGDADGALLRLGLASAHPNMLSISRLDKVKHCDDAIRAMAMVIARNPDVRGMIAGEGPMRAELESLIEHLGMTGKILLPGSVDQDTLNRIIPHCVTVSPLTGMALFETMLGASPAVAYDRDSQTAALVQSGQTGFLVPFRDWEALGEGAIKLVEDHGLRKAAGLSARINALAMADLDKLHRHEHAAFEAMFRRFGPLG